MRSLPTPNMISRALFETDPMRTCCLENTCFDEYDRVAAGASIYLEDGYTLAQALHKALRESFGIELAAGCDLTSALALIEPSARHHTEELENQYHNEIDGHWYKEYLLTFSNSGPITVCVKFEKSPASVADRRMQPQEINLLIDPYTGDFLTAMTFDEHLFELTRIYLSLTKKTLTIHARSPKEETAQGADAI